MLVGQQGSELSPGLRAASLHGVARGLSNRGDLGLLVVSQAEQLGELRRMFLVELTGAMMRAAHDWPAESEAAEGRTTTAHTRAELGADDALRQLASFLMRDLAVLHLRAQRLQLRDLIICQVLGHRAVGEIVKRRAAHGVLAMRSNVVVQNRLLFGRQQSAAFLAARVLQRLKVSAHLAEDVPRRSPLVVGEIEQIRRWLAAAESVPRTERRTALSGGKVEFIADDLLGLGHELIACDFSVLKLRAERLQLGTLLIGEVLHHRVLTEAARKPPGRPLRRIAGDHASVRDGAEQPIGWEASDQRAGKHQARRTRTHSNPSDHHRIRPFDSRLTLVRLHHGGAIDVTGNHTDWSVTRPSGARKVLQSSALRFFTACFAAARRLRCTIAKERVGAQTAEDANSMSQSRTEPRVLLIDDDVELCELLTEYLRSEHFAPSASHDPTEVIDSAMSAQFDLILLDVMLPSLNGLDVLRRIRAQCDTPVIMLTARGEDVDRIIGLELGADDYVPKPFSSRELVARMRAVLRRTDRAVDESRNQILKVDDVELDADARTVCRGGQLVELTGVEFSLLGMLLRAAGRVVRREELFRAVLGRREKPYDRSLDVHVSNLRKKLGHIRDGAERIKTLRGVGFVYTRTDSHA